MMGYAQQFVRPLSSDAQYAVAKYGWEDPNNNLRDLDIDLAGIESLIADLTTQAATLQQFSAEIGQTQPQNWSGGASQIYLTCGMRYEDWLNMITEKILWVCEVLVVIVNWITEIIRWLASLVNWVAGLLSVLGWIEKGMDQLGIRIPSWVRKIFNLVKQVEKYGKGWLAILFLAGWVLEKLMGWIDGLLDDLRESIYATRLSLRNCISDIEAPVPDEPIKPIPTF